MALLGRKGSYDRELNKTQLVFNFTESAKFQCFPSIYVGEDAEDRYFSKNKRLLYLTSYQVSSISDRYFLSRI